MRYRERRTAVCRSVGGVIVILALLGWAVRRIAAIIPSIGVPLVPVATLATAGNTLAVAGAWCWGVAGVMVLGVGVWWGLVHGLFFHGPRYALAHARMLRELRRSLLEVGTTFTVELGNGDVALPKIRVKFGHDLGTATITISNHIKYDADLEAVDLTPALGKYKVNDHALTRDGNAWEYQTRDATIVAHLTFASCEDMALYAKTADGGGLVLDKFTTIPLSSLLLVGVRGAGKSYALYGLILQMLSRENRPELFFIDPKRSGLGVLGRLIAPEHTAVTTDEAVELLERFDTLMHERAEEMEVNLTDGKIEADYTEFGLCPYILVFDEFAAFAAKLGKDKKTAAPVEALLVDIVLMGRQLGFSLWIAMQKSDATTIPTKVRDNLPVKIALGNCPATTLQTIFGESAELTGLRFKRGEGLCSVDEGEPQIVSCPTLDFDIKEATLALTGSGARGVITGIPTPQKEAKTGAGGGDGEC